MTNMISYRLDRRVAFPEIGLSEAGREALRPIRLDRFIAAIEDDRGLIVAEALSAALREGECLVALKVEDEKALASAPYMRRFLDQKLGISSRADGVSLLGRSVLMPGGNDRSNDFGRMVGKLVQAQLLFVMIFGVQDPRELSVDWDAIYAGNQVSVGDYLQPGEVGLFRSGFRSQDIFELSTIRLV